MYNKQKKIGYAHFFKNCLTCKKVSIKSSQHHDSAHRSRAASSFVTTRSRLAYEKTSDDCVVMLNQRVCEHLFRTSIQIPRPLSPPQQYSGSLYQLIWLYYYTNLGSVGSYILLLPTSKVEMRVKRQLLWQAGEDFRMWVTPAWCGWIGINASLDRNQPAS